MAQRSCAEHVSNFSVSLLDVHSVASTMTAPLLAKAFCFCFSAPGCCLRPLVLDLATLHAAEMPTKDTVKECFLRSGYRPTKLTKF